MNVNFSSKFHAKLFSFPFIMKLFTINFCFSRVLFVDKRVIEKVGNDISTQCIVFWNVKFCFFVHFCDLIMKIYKFTSIQHKLYFFSIFCTYSTYENSCFLHFIKTSSGICVNSNNMI